MTGFPHLAVIVPHYNDPDRLGHCLRALEDQIATVGEGAVEAVVVDNDSPCPMDAIREAHPLLHFVCETDKGAAAARNRGVAETTAPHLAFLDSDCIPAPDWLATALDLVGSDRVVGGRIDTFDETPPPRSGAEAFEHVFAFRQRQYVENMGFSVTANLLTSRAVFVATGPFRPGLSEDKDWCQRATAAGFPLVYVDALAVRHPTRQTWSALAKKWRRLTAESFALHGTTPARRVLWAMRAVTVAASALPHSRRLLTAPALSWQERWAGLVTLWRLRGARAAWMLGQAATGRQI